MAGPHTPPHTRVTAVINYMYTRPGQVEVKVQSAERRHTNNMLLSCPDVDTKALITALAAVMNAAPAVDACAHPTCTLTIYPVCSAWIRSSRRRRRSWLCRPSPGRSPLWTPHRSGQTSTRCHRTGRCWENPAGQRDRHSARESNKTWRVYP